MTQQPKISGYRALKFDVLAGLTRVQQTQTSFWQALRDFETLTGVELKSTHDFANDDPAEYWALSKANKGLQVLPTKGTV